MIRLALLLALIPTPALADGFTNREIAFQVLNAADAAQTCDFLRRGTAHELNPLYGKHPSCAKVVAFKAIGGGIHYALVSKINETDPELAKWVQIITIAVQGGVVAANLRFAF